MEDEGTERCVSQAERTSQFKSLRVPSGCDAWPCCRSRCSSGNSVAAMSEHSSKSSLLWYSSDTMEVLSDWSVVSERAWQLDGVSGRWWSLVWSDSMSLSFCCSSLLSLQEKIRTYSQSQLLVIHSTKVSGITKESGLTFSHLQQPCGFSLCYMTAT